MIKNAVIIGAGPAGLTAALELLEKAPGVSVTVLEAADAVGGISRTVCFDGNRMDLGGHRFFSKDERVLRRWESLLPMQGAPALDDRLLGRDVPLLKGGPDPEREDGVMLRRSRVSRIYWNGRFFDYPVTLSAGTLKNMGLRVAAQVGMRPAMGLRNSAAAKQAAVTRLVRPVRPPSATPALDSTKVVTVEVPQMAPVQVAMASESMAWSMLGTSPSAVSMSPRAQAPYSVPMVSNISTRQKASAVVQKLRTRLAMLWLAR